MKKQVQSMRATLAIHTSTSLSSMLWASDNKFPCLRRKESTTLQWEHKKRLTEDEQWYRTSLTSLTGLKGLIGLTGLTEVRRPSMCSKATRGVALRSNATPSPYLWKDARITEQCKSCVALLRLGCIATHPPRASQRPHRPHRPRRPHRGSAPRRTGSAVGFEGHPRPTRGAPAPNRWTGSAFRWTGAAFRWTDARAEAP